LHFNDQLKQRLEREKSRNKSKDKSVERVNSKSKEFARIYSVDNLTFNQFCKNPITKFFNKKNQLLKRSTEQVQNNLEKLSKSMLYENLTTKDIFESLKKKKTNLTNPKTNLEIQKRVEKRSNLYTNTKKVDTSMDSIN